jgi:hypothetical protein
MSHEDALCPFAGDCLPGADGKTGGDTALIGGMIDVDTDSDADTDTGDAFDTGTDAGTDSGTGAGAAVFAGIIEPASLSRFMDAHSFANVPHDDMLCPFVGACLLCAGGDTTDDDTGGDTPARLLGGGVTGVIGVTDAGSGAGVDTDTGTDTGTGTGTGTVVAKLAALLTLASLSRFIDAHSLANVSQEDVPSPCDDAPFVTAGGDTGGDTAGLGGVTNAGLGATFATLHCAAVLAGVLVLASLSRFIDAHSFASASSEDALCAFCGASFLLLRTGRGDVALGGLEVVAGLCAGTGTGAAKLVCLAMLASLSRFMDAHSFANESHDDDMLCPFADATLAGTGSGDTPALGSANDADLGAGLGAGADAARMAGLPVPVPASLSPFIDAHSLASESHDVVDVDDDVDVDDVDDTPCAFTDACLVCSAGDDIVVGDDDTDADTFGGVSDADAGVDVDSGLRIGKDAASKLVDLLTLASLSLSLSLFIDAHSLANDSQLDEDEDDVVVVDDDAVDPAVVDMTLETF